MFVGGFSFEAAEAVAGSEDGGDVLEGLTSLVGQSLLHQSEWSGETRLGMLESIRDYALEKLAEDGELDELRHRHGAFFFALAEEAEGHLRGAEQALWLDRLEVEFANLRAARAWFEQSRAAGSAVTFAASLWRFWYMRGHLSEGRAWLTRALAQGESLGDTTRAKALNGAGVLALSQGDNLQARALYEESLAIGRDLGDKRSISSALIGLGHLARQRGDYSSARSLYEESLALEREMEDRWGAAAVLNNLGNVAFSQGDYAGARSHYEESLSIMRELGDVKSVAHTLFNLGNIAQDQGDYGRAGSLVTESLRIFRELKDSQSVAAALNNLALLALDRGDHASARRSLEEALTIKQTVGDKQGISLALLNLGRVARHQGNDQAAQALLEESLVMARELGDRQNIAFALLHLGKVALEQGAYDLAHARYRESLSLEKELGDKSDAAALLEAFAELSAIAEQPVKAACLWGAADILREEVGAPLPPSERSSYDRIVTTTRNKLGEEQFEGAWMKGRSLTLQQAVAYALEDAAGA